MDTLTLILYPFIFILDYFFSLISLALKDYPLIAIIFFACLISLILKPLQGPLRKIETNIAKKINLIEDEFNKLSINMSGEEKFFLREKIYKKYSYSPFHSFLQAISFFALIPFLISVIIVFEGSWLINNSNIFGVKLSEPDGLLFGFNLLPLLMFVGTYLDSNFRYSNDKSSKNRFLIISIVLFFLVYNMSSALILFWITMNCISMVSHFYNDNES